MTTDPRHVSHWEAVSTSRLVPASCELCAAMDFEHRWWHVLQVADCHGKEVWQPLGSTDVPGLVAATPVTYKFDTIRKRILQIVCSCVEKTSTSYPPSPSIFLARIGICLWSPSPRWRNNRAQKQVVNVYLFLSYAPFQSPWHPLFDCSCCQTYQLPKVEVWTDGLFKHYRAVFQTSHWNMGTKSLYTLRPWPMVRGAMSPAWCKRLHRKCHSSTYTYHWS